MRKALAACLCLYSWGLFSLAAAALERQPNAVYRSRRETLAKKIEKGLIVVFGEGEPADISRDDFRQSDNFYYLTGWAQPNAALLIVPAMAASEGTPARSYSEILFLSPRNLPRERWTGPKLGPDDPEISTKTGFTRVESLDKLPIQLSALSPQGFTTVYTELPSPAEHSTSAALWDWVQRFVPTQFQDIEPSVSDLRRIKDAGELEYLRKATAASIAAHQAAIRELKPGINEGEIAGLMYYNSAKEGCEGWAYAPIVGSGFNGTVLHYGANSKVVQSGELVVLDVACEYSMYASDITRTLPANGKFTPRQREIYDIVYGAQQAAIAAFQPGKSTIGKTTPDSLYKIAYDYINSHGKDLHGQPLGKYFIHGLGHYVGLEVHDVGDYKKPLDKGTVFTIEPGIYLPEEKLGVRIEDIFYVDQSGKLLNMTAPLPHTADEVERAMAQSKVVH